MVDFLILTRGATVQETNNETDISYNSYSSQRDPAMAKTKGPEKKPENEGWTTVRISLAVRLFLEENSLKHRMKKGVITRESVDTILRRIFGIEEDKK